MKQIGRFQHKSARAKAAPLVTLPASNQHSSNFTNAGIASIFSNA